MRPLGLIHSILMIATFSTAAYGAEPISSSGCQARFSRIYGLSPKDEGLLSWHNGDFFSLRPLEPIQAEKLNEQTLKALREEAPPRAGGVRKTALNHSEIEKLFQDIMANRQVKESLFGSYNGSPDLGFCWGRAMVAHMKALMAGTNNKSIRKVWVVGDLQSGGTSWRYHVATMVRGEGNQWQVLDPIQGRPMSVEAWYADIKGRFDSNGKMRLLSTPARRFGAISNDKYNRKELVSEAHYSFFIDLMDEIAKENTGKPGPWTRLKNEGERRKWETNLRKYLAPTIVSTTLSAEMAAILSDAPSKDSEEEKE